MKRYRASSKVTSKDGDESLVLVASKWREYRVLSGADCDIVEIIEGEGEARVERESERRFVINFSGNRGRNSAIVN